LVVRASRIHHPFDPAEQLTARPRVIKQLTATYFTSAEQPATHFIRLTKQLTTN
jgi:hypothetical protein